MSSVSKNTLVLKIRGRRIHRRAGIVVTEESLLDRASKDPDFTLYWITYRHWANNAADEWRTFTIRPTFMLSEHTEARGNLHFVRIVFENNANTLHQIPRWFPRYEQPKDCLDRNVLHMSVAFDNDVQYICRKRISCSFRGMSVPFWMTISGKGTQLLRPGFTTSIRMLPFSSNGLTILAWSGCMRMARTWVEILDTFLHTMVGCMHHHPPGLSRQQICLRQGVVPADPCILEG